MISVRPKSPHRSRCGVCGTRCPRYDRGKGRQRWRHRLASLGMNNPDIARELFISRNTVKAHLSRAYAKLGVSNRTELTRLAIQHAQDQ